MQVSRTNELKSGRGYHSIGRVKASSGWRASDAHEPKKIVCRPYGRQSAKRRNSTPTQLSVWILKSRPLRAPILTAHPCSGLPPWALR